MLCTGEEMLKRCNGFQGFVLLCTVAINQWVQSEVSFGFGEIHLGEIGRLILLNLRVFLLEVSSKSENNNRSQSPDVMFDGRFISSHGFSSFDRLHEPRVTQRMYK